MPVFALWSAPRARSTAFFRSMVERGDLLALHEPFWNLRDFGETEVDGRTFDAPSRSSHGCVTRPMTSTSSSRRRPTPGTERSSPTGASSPRPGTRSSSAVPRRSPRPSTRSWPDMRIDEVGLEALHELHAAVRDAGGTRRSSSTPTTSWHDPRRRWRRTAQPSSCRSSRRRSRGSRANGPSGGGPHAGTRTSAPAPASCSASAVHAHRRELRRAGAVRRPPPAVLRAAPRAAAQRRGVGANGRLLTEQPGGIPSACLRSGTEHRARSA